MSADDFEENGVMINEISDHSMIRLKKIAESHDHCMDLVQFTANNSAIVFNLTDERPYIVDICHDLDQFKYPLYFSSSGFNYHSKNQIMQVN